MNDIVSLSAQIKPLVAESSLLQALDAAASARSHLREAIGASLAAFLPPPDRLRYLQAHHELTRAAFGVTSVQRAMSIVQLADGYLSAGQTVTAYQLVSAGAYLVDDFLLCCL